MKDEQTMTSSSHFNGFLLKEGLRQDAMIHNMAARLGTKNGLLMVFAAFIFAAESAFVIVSLMFGLQLPRWSWGGSLMLCLASIGVLLRSIWLEKYRIPPVLPLLREQADQYFSFPDIQQLSDERQMEKFQEKFVNSISRCVRDNFQVNAKIHKNIEIACWLIIASVLCIAGCLIWIL